jgi:hypothetical protein
MCTRNEGVVLRVFKDIYVVPEYVQGVQERRLGVEALPKRMVEGYRVAAEFLTVPGVLFSVDVWCGSCVEGPSTVDEYLNAVVRLSKCRNRIERVCCM